MTSPPRPLPRDTPPTALHRRLLDQLARMRLELPPVCRLAAASSPLNRPGPRHRALAEMEDKLHCLVSRDSLRKLAPILTDPLLKLDEVRPSRRRRRRRPPESSSNLAGVVLAVDDSPIDPVGQPASHPFSRVVSSPLCQVPAGT